MAGEEAGVSVTHLYVRSMRLCKVKEHAQDDQSIPLVSAALAFTPPQLNRLRLKGGSLGPQTWLKVKEFKTVLSKS